ncbi:ABC-2 type transport system permease protein [Afifella marina DSM 2698]|uniref:ABC-2 type transport system permease protein n=2 Tax=Afifella marina TaxID=1080 RepID=A0A1G5NCE2_AFIMA|nr:ABC-2 type transport system permease protein [Afifella marina DSM 2698]
MGRGPVSGVFLRLFALRRRVYDHRAAASPSLFASLFAAGTLKDDTMLSASLNRIFALVLRYWYLLKDSWPRLLDIVYWPTVELLMWGFLQAYLAEKTSVTALAGGALIGSVLLWDILLRGQIGFSVSFLEEMWSRNLGNLMMTPLRMYELLAALGVMSIIRLLIGLVPVTVMAIVFFGFNLLGMGLALAAFFANLIITSWAVGLFACGIVLRNGLGAESFVWSVSFLLLPLACVYYPVTVLPAWLQPISLALPPTHVFEGMRALILENRFDVSEMLWAGGLNLVYLTAASIAFAAFLRSARRSGALLQLGE